jgi:hypothetical protein
MLNLFVEIHFFIIFSSFWENTNDSIFELKIQKKGLLFKKRSILTMCSRFYISCKLHGAFTY